MTTEPDLEVRETVVTEIEAEQTALLQEVRADLNAILSKLDEGRARFLFVGAEPQAIATVRAVVAGYNVQIPAAPPPAPESE